MQAGREVGYMQNTRDAGRARHGMAEQPGGNGSAPWLWPQLLPALSDSSAA